jgi:hypothetical protein
VGTRIGIELSPVACRLVEVDGPDIVPGRPLATRVQSFSILPPSGPETIQQLELIGRRPVSVVLWGVRSDHRQVVVSKGSYEKMRAEALASARAAGVDPRGTFADIAPASVPIKGVNRQTVVLALANAADVSVAIRPLVEARVRIRSIVTPADALLGLARSRPALVPGGIEAYVALDATVTCVALVRDGALLGARELPWGYQSPAAPAAAPQHANASPRRDDLAVRLADELADFLMLVGARHDHDAVTQVSICGGLAELRTMSVPLMERLDVEVETLDSLFAIDVNHLPEPADEFRERAAELRLAWSAAADWRGPINLLRYRRRRGRRVALARAAVVAGVAVGLGSGWAIERSQWWQSTAPQPTARTTPPPVVPPRPSAPARANTVSPPETPTAAVSKPNSPSPLVATVSPPGMSPPTAATPLAVPPASPSAVVATKPPAVTPVPPPRASMLSAGSVAAPASRGTGSTGRSTASTATAASKLPATLPPVPVPPAVAKASVPAPPVVRGAPSGPAPAEAPSRVTSVVTGRPGLLAPARPDSEALPNAVTRVTPAQQPRPAQPPPVPFPAVLGTILYSPDRKLAIVNDRIVGPGDEVNGARIVDITPTTVLLRDAQGRLRSLTLGAARTPPAP